MKDRLCQVDKAELVVRGSQEDPFVELIIDERLKVHRYLGAGGMGHVYIARQLDATQREVAVKFIRQELMKSEEDERRFFREVRTLASGAHANVVGVYFSGYAEVTGKRIPYFAMELIKGNPLSDFIGKGKRLAPQKVCRMGTNILRGLEALHDAGLIHRDIKPANILVLDGCEEEIKILDFGLAKGVATEEEERITATNMVLGTPAYMSPEQMLGWELDARADLYSVGVILYEMVTGYRPVRESLGAVPTPRENFPELDIPELLNDYVVTLVLPDRDKRPATARAALTQLEEILEALLTAARSAGRARVPSREVDEIAAQETRGVVSGGDLADANAETVMSEAVDMAPGGGATVALEDRNAPPTQTAQNLEDIDPSTRIQMGTKSRKSLFFGAIAAGVVLVLAFALGANWLRDGKKSEVGSGTGEEKGEDRDNGMGKGEARPGSGELHVPDVTSVPADHTAQDAREFTLSAVEGAHHEPPTPIYPADHTAQDVRELTLSAVEGAHHASDVTSVPADHTARDVRELTLSVVEGALHVSDVTSVSTDDEAMEKAREIAKIEAAARARRKAEREAMKKADEEAKKKAEAEAKKKAEAEAKKKAEAEAKKKAEAEAKKKAEAEAKKKAEDKESSILEME